MVAYEVFKSLGVQVDVRPILDFTHKRQQGWFDEYDRNGNYKESDYFEHDCIGKNLAQTVGTELNTEYWSMKEIADEFPNEKIKIKWLNAPVMGTANVQFSYPTVSYYYNTSFDAMLMVPVR
jgi:hypothetical protein